MSLTIGGIFSNRLLYSLLFLGNFCGGQGFDGGRQSCEGVSPSPPPLGKTLNDVTVASFLTKL